MSEYDSTPSDAIETEIEIRVAARTKELEAAGRALLEWDKKYPIGTTFTYLEHSNLDNALAAIIERFSELLGDTKP